MEPNNTENEETYLLPNEQNTPSNTPSGIMTNNPNTWLFIMIIVALGSLFGIYATNVNSQLKTANENSERWEKRYDEERKEFKQYIIDNPPKKNKQHDETPKESTTE